MLCKVCGEPIPEKRIQILPGTKTCVKHSSSSKLVGMPITIGKGDDTYTDLNIMSEEIYRKINPTSSRDTLAGLGTE